MQHPPPSSAAPAVPGSSFSADPTTVHDTNKNTNTNKSSSKFKKLRITKDIEVFDIPPYKPRPNEKKLVHDDKRYKPNVDLSNIVFKPGPALDVFDAKNPPPKFAFPVHFEEDPSLRLRLTECATLAIGDYNSQTKSDYRFVDIEMATSQLVNGTFYNITFQAMNAMKKCETFEATVFFNRRVREVQQIRMKGSDDWYVGTLSELVKFETMAGWIDVHATFNGGEPQRLKVRCLDVTLRDLKDQLNEFNQGVNPRDTRRVQNVRYKRPKLDEGSVSFTWVELKNDENVTSMFWEHTKFQWIDMRVTLLRSTEDIINSLIPREDRH